jgi:3-hydroxyisobutyrate dehydrogenase
VTNARLGFIGLGNMGGRMAACLIAAGHEVLGYDTDPDRASAVGAVPAPSVAAVLEGADIVLMSLPDSKVVEAVVLGAGGVLESCRTGQIVVDLSTSSPESTVALSGQLAERDVSYVDAGISGGAAAAAKGELTLMVGGDTGVADSIAWVFDPIATRVVHMGGSGAGHLTKVLNNFLNAVSLAATAEVMVAAKKAGLDLERTLEVINASSGVNFATLKRFPSIIHGDYLEGGLTNALMTKDVALYVDAAGRLGIASLMASGPLAAFGLANNLGYADQISNRVVDALGDVAGGVRLYENGEPA